MNPFEYTQNQSSKIQYVPLDLVIEMILRDYKFIKSVNLSDALEWIGNVYGRINYPGMFLHKITGTDPWTPNIDVDQYRGSLPLGFRKVLKAGVRDADSKTVYRPSTDTFTGFQHALNEAPRFSNTDKVYNIRGGYIFTGDESVTLEIAYESFPIDERGFPLVPDNEQVLEYAKEFISEKIAFNMFAANKLNREVYDIVDRRRMWRAGAAHASLVNRTPDEMESWTRTRLKLIPRLAAFDSSFAYNGNLEDLALGTNL